MMLNRLFSVFRGSPQTDSPDVRSGHKATVAGPYIIIFGGYNNVGNHRVFTEIWFYHIYFKKWQRFALPPNFVKATLSSSISFFNGKIYIFGGTGYPFAQESADYFIVFDMVKQTWRIIGDELSSRNSLLRPEKKYSQSMVFYENKFYIFGGTTGFVENNELNIFDLTEEKWIPIIPTPSGINPPSCFRHEAFVYNHKMYIVGGAISSSTRLYSFKIIPTFNLKTHEWDEITTIGDIDNDYPSIRTCFAAAHHGDFLYLCGGKGSEDVVYDDFWRLDLITMTWSKLKIKLQEPIYFHSLSYGNDDRLYVFGGVRNDFNTRVNTLQIVTHTVQRLMHIAAGVVASNQKFDSFVSKHTLTEFRPCQPFELCFQKV